MAQDDFRKKFHIDSKDIVIGAVGRFSPEKGLEYLISAIREVVNVHPRTKVIIVGNGEDKYRLSLQEKVKDLELRNFICKFSNSAGVHLLKLKWKRKLMPHKIFRSSKCLQ